MTTQTTYAACIYCSKTTRKWTQNVAAVDDNILFVLCSPTSGKPYRFYNAVLVIGDNEEVRPLPLVKGSLMNNAKMSNYQLVAVKEYVVMQEWKNEYGQGEFKDEPPAKRAGRAIPPIKKDDLKPTTPPTATKHSPRDRQEKQPSPRRTPQLKKEETLKTPQRNHPQTDPYSPPKPTPLRSINDPDLDSLILSPIPVNFINEVDLDEVKSSSNSIISFNTDKVHLSDKELDSLDQLDVGLSNLEQLVSEFAEPIEDKNASIFSMVGVASYFGYKYDYEDKINAPPIYVAKETPKKYKNTDNIENIHGSSTSKLLQKQSAMELPKMRPSVPPPIIGTPPPSRALPSVSVSTSNLPSRVPPSVPPPRNIPNTQSATNMATKQAPPPIIGAPPTVPRVSVALPGMSKSVPPPIVGAPPTGKKLPSVIWENDNLKLTKEEWDEIIGSSSLSTRTIDFYMGLQNKLVSSKAFFFLHSGFYDQLINDATALYSFIEESELIEYEKIIFPIKIEHDWCLSVANIKSNQLEWYGFAERDAEEITKPIIKLFKDTSKFGKKKSRKTVLVKKEHNLKLSVKTDVPIASNSEASGVYILSYSMHILEETEMSFHSDQRSRIAKKIVENIDSITPLEAVLKSALLESSDTAATIGSETSTQKQVASRKEKTKSRIIQKLKK